jgi:hypothetical protein
MSPFCRAGLAPDVFRIGGREFKIKLPEGFKLVASSKRSDGNYPPSMEWARRPWSPGFLMETRNANVLFVSYYTAEEFSRLSKSDGSMYASSYYLDTILKHHDQVQIYKSQSGRAPAIIRYDIKSGGGVFCLVASVDSYGNPKYDSDVQDLSASLKTFVPVQGRDK